MRVNFWSGASSGKSTIAAGCYYHLKCKSYNVELVREFIKKWAYENKKPKSFDQVFIFGSQVNAEDHLLQHGVEHVITDSPLLMQVFYARRYNFCCWQELLQIGKQFELLYPSINIFLDREGLVYHQGGRYENEKQAQEVDQEMRTYMNNFTSGYKTFNSMDLDQIVDYVESQISR